MVCSDASTAVPQEIQRYWDGYAAALRAGDVEWGSRAFYRGIKYNHDKAFAYSNEIVNFPAHAGRSVLGICCGVGLDALEFARNGASVTFMSPSPKINELTRKYFEDNGQAVRLEFAAAEQLPFPSGSFDVVDARGILMYTPSPERVVDEIHRVMRPGGVVYAHMHNRFSWYALLSAVSGTNVIQEGGDPPFRRLHSVRDARRMFRQFASVDTVLDRFPSCTADRMGGLAFLYNNVLVPFTKVIPRSLMRPFGWYIIIKGIK